MNWDRLAGEIDVTKYLPDRNLGRLTAKALQADTINNVAFNDAVSKILLAEPFGFDEVVEGPLPEDPLQSFRDAGIEGPIYDFTDPSFTGL